MPAARAGFQYMFIYFKGPKPTVDIQLDDLYLGEILQRPDWKSNSDLLIDKYRKRNVRLRFVRSNKNKINKTQQAQGRRRRRRRRRMGYSLMNYTGRLRSKGNLSLSTCRWKKNEEFHGLEYIKG